MTSQYDSWTIADGSEIPITEMTDEHIVNTIRALDEGRIFVGLPKSREAWSIILKGEALRRGRDWTQPAFDKVGLVAWVLKSLGRPELLASAERLLKTDGLEDPEVDVSRYSGKVTYRHWQTGGTPVKQLKLGDSVRVRKTFRLNDSQRYVGCPNVAGEVGRINSIDTAGVVVWVAIQGWNLNIPLSELEPA